MEIRKIINKPDLTATIKTLGINKVSKASGISYSYVHKVAQGGVKVRAETYERLRLACEKIKAENSRLEQVKDGKKYVRDRGEWVEKGK